MKFISAIIRIYQRNLKYIGDFANISTFQQKTTTIAKLIFSFIDG
ncbi:hypothetical protein OCB70_14860 [Bacillus cereus]|nr:hypothetical protein [Bacillus thuringiensis]MCU4979935.1 hypothetical protein [Bacillus cereus]MCU5147929.1 hypothetical protein [Bacillus cereus]MCU5493657.1 hypothetical protein [Bacillus cereus]MCU5699436.1 hypothetical protein [Bacillus cereus]MDY7520129.1 hypothetical protein [Bacillus thuringiensis]